MELGSAPRCGPRALPATSPSGPSPRCDWGLEPCTQGHRPAAKAPLLTKRGAARCTTLGMIHLSFGGKPSTGPRRGA